jgi:hypothetical protein
MKADMSALRAFRIDAATNSAHNPERPVSRLDSGGINLPIVNRAS